MTIEQKWDVVKNYYEKIYKIKFKEKPLPIVIQHFFNEIQKLKMTYLDLAEQDDSLPDKVVKTSELKQIKSKRKSFWDYSNRGEDQS